MFDILVKVGLGEHYGVFLVQKITPDIVCCLAAIEMQQLGISTKKDMVKLRSECANYGIRKPQMSQSECGPPKFMIPKDVLENLIDEDFVISKIAKFLPVIMLPRPAPLSRNIKSAMATFSFPLSDRTLIGRP
jgi:hypothetical protein